MKANNLFTSKISLIVYLTVVALTSLFIAVQVNVKDTSALSPSDFNPGRIIDDAVFYNSNAMTAQQIQTFLNERMPNCDTNGTGTVSYYYNPNTKYVSYGTHQPGASWVTTTRAVYGERAYQYRISVGLADNGSRAPYSCLKDYRMNVPQQPAASGLCSQINAMTNATSAQIIKAVADACGINPQVILVILEKEQSLVQGDNWPFGTRYSHAMGYACPDTAACDVNYEGLFKQIYHGAKQYKIYQKYPNNYNYRAGQNNIILYNPDSRCGTSTVFIENQATAGLYIYTPYQPNQAALNWKLGSGGAVSTAYPGCGAFGNINFFMLFTNWFGSTSAFIAEGGIGARWQEIGAEKSKLRYPNSGELTGLSQGGAVQWFEGGQIFWHPIEGAWDLSGAIRSHWNRIGAENSKLGYPTSGEKVDEQNNIHQEFQNGRIYWNSKDGTSIVMNYVYDRWILLGGRNGSMGSPKDSGVCNLKGSGCMQSFKSGDIYWSPETYAWDVSGGIRYLWASLGAEKSKLGYPITGEKTDENSKIYQEFQNGRIYWNVNGGSKVIHKNLGARWQEIGAEKSKLRYPNSGELTGLSQGGAVQWFEGGQIFWHPIEGAWDLSGAIRSHWNRIGAENSKLGYPTSGEKVDEQNNIHQEFQNGRIYWNSKDGTSIVMN